jgi:moderate conductance mechanosensitive channel
VLSPLRDPSPAPVPTPTCHDAPELCHRIYQWTGQTWLAEGSYYLLIKPLRILLIVVLAIVARYLLHRLINRLVRQTLNNESWALFRPLRERIPTALREAAGLASERRRQRAEALGSVLRSIASATVFGIAVMLVLSELGIDLAPLLAVPGWPDSRSASVHRTWSRTSWPGCSCCWRTSTGWATSSTWVT